MLLRFLKKDQTENIHQFFSEVHTALETHSINWMALAINDRMIKDSLLTKELVFYTKDNHVKNSFSVQLADKNNALYTKLNKGQNTLVETEIEAEKNIKKQLKHLVESYMLEQFEFFKTQMNNSEFSPLQIENEEKALEWIRVSFEVLKKGIIESVTNPEFLFQAKIFAGINPQTKEREIRIINFNLDMTLILLSNNNLRVIIYNRKPGISSKDLKPSLIGDYSFRKREIFDHIIDLFSLIIKPIEA